MLNKVSEDLILRNIIAIILLLPLIATLGQYISSGFILESTDIAILYWPGVKEQFRIMLPVYIIIGVMLISYVIGIGFMYRRKTLVKVIFIGLVSMKIAQLVGSLVNSFAGWHEMQNISDVSQFRITNIMNKIILSSWHDPVWEELVFTGIPLIFLNVIKNRTSKRTYKIGIVMYLILPSIAMAMYHIPNHGLARIADTLISHAVSLYLALRYSFFAPLVLHYVEDAFIIISIDKLKGAPLYEINWIVQNSSILNNIFATGLLIFLILIPILSIWYLRGEKEIRDNLILKKRTIVLFIVVLLFIGVYIANNFN